MNRLRGKLAYANVCATLALFLALAGGTAFAATQLLPRNSVGARQLKRGAVTPPKLSRRRRGAERRDRAQGPKGPPVRKVRPGPRVRPARRARPGTGDRPVPRPEGRTRSPTALWAEVSAVGGLLRGSHVAASCRASSATTWWSSTRPSPPAPPRPPWPAKGSPARSSPAIRRQPERGQGRTFEIKGEAEEAEFSVAIFC